MGSGPVRQASVPVRARFVRSVERAIEPNDAQQLERVATRRQAGAEHVVEAQDLLRSVIDRFPEMYLGGSRVKRSVFVQSQVMGRDGTDRVRVEEVCNDPTRSYASLLRVGTLQHLVDQVQEWPIVTVSRVGRVDQLLEAEQLRHEQRNSSG